LKTFVQNKKDVRNLQCWELDLKFDAKQALGAKSHEPMLVVVTQMPTKYIL